MKSSRYQKGMSMWQLSYVLGSLAVFGMVGTKSIPLYLEHLSIERAVKGTASSGNADPASAHRELQRRWDIEDIKSLLVKDVKVVRTEKGVALQYEYDVGVDLFGNARLVFHFAGNEPVTLAGQ